MERARACYLWWLPMPLRLLSSRPRLAHRRFGPHSQAESTVKCRYASGAPSHAAIQRIVAAARRTLLASFAKYGKRNEVFAGMQTSISWNVIYTPYEGIITPVFRGSPWKCSEPHNVSNFRRRPSVLGGSRQDT